LGGVDKSNIITSGRTRGKRINYTEDPGIGGLGVKNGSGAEEEGRKETNGAPATARTKSPQRKPEKPVEEVEENEGEEDESEGGDEDEDEDEDDDDDEEAMGSEEEDEEE
jgi:hypothetical protein